MSSTVETNIDIRPFTSRCRRPSSPTCAGALLRTRWPEKETVADSHRAPTLATIRGSPTTGPRTTTGAGARRS